MKKNEIFSKNEKIELIEGNIILMSKVFSEHAACIERLGDLIRPHLKSNLMLRMQNPITLGKHSEPRPDLCLVEHRNDYYTNAHPQPDDIVTIIEVADSSEQFDRNIKMSLYARFGIKESWIVCINSKSIEVYKKPSPDGYNEIQIYRFKDQINSNLFDGIMVNEIFQ